MIRNIESSRPLPNENPPKELNSKRDRAWYQFFVEYLVKRIDQNAKDIRTIHKETSDKIDGVRDRDDKMHQYIIATGIALIAAIIALFGFIVSTS